MASIRGEPSAGVRERVEVARTIAGLAGSPSSEPPHVTEPPEVTEAIRYHKLDREVD